MLIVAFVRCKSGLFTNFGILFFSVTNSQLVRCKSRSASKVVDSPAERRSNPVRRCWLHVTVWMLCSVNACTNADEMALPVTLITPLWPSGRRPLPHSPRVVRRLRCTIARVRWLDSALRRLYSTWKACDRNRTMPCSHRDFDCDRFRPKYSIFDYV